MSALAMLAEWTHWGWIWLTGWCCWGWDRLDGWLVAASIPAWCILLLCLSPALLRLVLRRPCYLDPIWAMVAMLALNRLSFLLHISIELSHATALVLCLAMAVLSRSYQIHDREVPHGP